MRVIEEGLLKDFLMEACPVEASSHTECDIMLEGLIAGSGHNAIGVVSLVEYETLKDHLSIYFDSFALNAHVPQSCVAGEMIDGLAVRRKQDDFQVIEVRVSWRPEATAFCGDGKVESRGKVTVARAVVRRNDTSGIAQSGCQFHARLDSGNRLLQAYQAIRHIRR